MRCLQPNRWSSGLAAHDDVGALEDTLTGMVTGALDRGISPQDLVRAVHLASSGIVTISPQLLTRYRPARNVEQRLIAFAKNEREREVLRLLFLGRTNDQIAHELSRSSSSVKQILSAMCERARATNRGDLIARLLQDPPESPRG